MAEGPAFGQPLTDLRKRFRRDLGDLKLLLPPVRWIKRPHPRLSGSRLAWSELLITGVAFLLRASRLSFQSLWRDEVDSLRFAIQPLRSLVASFVAPGQNGPLYYLLLRPWQDATGQTEFSLRYFSAIAGTLAVPLVFRLGRRLAPSAPAVGIVGSLLAAVSPYLVWYSQEARMYAAVVCLSLGSLECLLSSIEKGGRWRWTAYVMLTAAAFYLHFLTVLMVPVHFVAALGTGRRHSPPQIRCLLAAVVALAMLYLPLLAWQLPALLSPVDGGYSFVPFPQMIATLAAAYTSGVLGSYPMGALAGFIGLAGIALICAERDSLRPLGTLVAWLLLPVLALFLITTVRPMFTARYLVFVLPALLLLAAKGWQAAARRSPGLAAVAVAVVVTLNLVSLRQQAVTPVKADMRSATAYVVARLAPNDAALFQIPYLRHTFEYYAARLRSGRPKRALVGANEAFFPLVGGATATWWIDGPYTNDGVPASVVDMAMRALVKDRDVIWLVASEVPLWDARDLVRQWLSDHGTITEQRTFVGVSVYRYELRRDISRVNPQPCTRA